MFGKYLANVRNKQNLTQSEIAERMGVSRSRVNNIERGRNPSLSSIREYLRACGYKARIAVMDASSNCVCRMDLDCKLRKMRKIRKSAGLSQAVLGEKIGLSRSRVEQIESGTEDILIGTLSNYLKGCGLTPMLDLAKARFRRRKQDAPSATGSFKPSASPPPF